MGSSSRRTSSKKPTTGDGDGDDDARPAVVGAEEDLQEDLEEGAAADAPEDDDGGDGDDDEADKVGYPLLITWLTLCACGCFLTIVAAVVVSAIILYNKQQARGSYDTLNQKTNMYDNL